jgi:DNA (cytosine-5)-methyltransferase 1
MRIGSLFSGVGGLEKGLEDSGLGHVVWQVEKEEYCRQVLARHWPGVKRYGDIESVDADDLERVDAVVGGFPCGDISSAGKGEGLAGSRSGLWYQFSRIVRALQPRWVVVENVSSGARKWVDAVCLDLGQQGYETISIPMSAAGIGAPHERARVFVVAKHVSHSNGFKLRQRTERKPGGRTDRVRHQGEPVTVDVGFDPKRFPPGPNSVDEWRRWSGPQPSILRGVGRTPRRLDRTPRGRRLKKLQKDRHRAIGNCVVPGCAEVVGWVIRELEG